MINERIALLLLNGEAGCLSNNAHYTREFYQCMEGFANAAIAICRSGNLKKFEGHLNIARKLYRDGNETVKNGIINVFLYKALDTIDQIPAARLIAESVCRVNFSVKWTVSIIERHIKIMKITYGCVLITVGLNNKNKL